MSEFEKDPLSDKLEVDTFEGKVHVEWEPEASVTPMGQLALFIQLLKIGYRFEPWIRDCPLLYKSNNGSGKLNVLGSLMLSILSGHKRYAHISTLIGDHVNPQLLGMKKIVSDDSARRLSENSARSEDGSKLRIKIPFCEVNSGSICRTKRNF